ncbi:MAG: site-specific integrase [Thaumarchaeota archaeon]|nr:site-specific integrase [Nitrososphaerota archaeon]
MKTCNQVDRKTPSNRGAGRQMRLDLVDDHTVLSGKIEISIQHKDPTSEVAERLTDMGTNKQPRATTTKDTVKTTNNNTKRTRLLANLDIKRWYDNMARGSALTAEGRLRRLGRFCEVHQTTPMQLADLATRDLRTATDLLEDHITMMESEEYSPGYVDEQIKAVKSWLRHFDVEIKRKIRVSGHNFTPTLQNERVPSAQEMAELYSRAGLRESVIISLMAKSGLRPEVIGNHNGTDGLQMRDMPDLVIQQGVVRCARHPNRIVVRRELSKAGHQYFTFSTRAATDQLVSYLNDRLSRGEPLHGSSPVVAPDYVYKTGRGNNSEKTFLPTQRVSRIVRQTFGPRFAWRPYILRPYFDTQLLIAESKGKMAHDFRVFFMGHKGTMESRYTTNKGVLPEVLMAEMREAFMRSEEHLDQLDGNRDDEVMQQRLAAQQAIETATPEQLGHILEALGAGKMMDRAAAAAAS